MLDTDAGSVAGASWPTHWLARPSCPRPAPPSPPPRAADVIAATRGPEALTPPFPHACAHLQQHLQDSPARVCFLKMHTTRSTTRKPRRRRYATISSFRSPIWGLAWRPVCDIAVGEKAAASLTALGCPPALFLNLTLLDLGPDISRSLVICNRGTCFAFNKQPAIFGAMFRTSSAQKGGEYNSER